MSRERTVRTDRLSHLADSSFITTPTSAACEFAGNVGLCAVSHTSGKCVIGYLGPNRARELAFSLLDMADLAELDVGEFTFDHDPFEQQLIEEAAAALAAQI